MTASVFTGPLISAGPMLGGVPGSAIPADYSTGSGPSLFYKSSGLIDPRQGSINKDNLLPATIESHLDCPSFFSVNTAPSTFGTATIAALANVTNGTAMTLVAANATGIAINIPFMSLATSKIQGTGISLDFGFDTLGTTSGSATATPAGTIENYFVGMPIVVAGAGNSAGTMPLLTYVQSVGSTTIVMAATAKATITAAAVGTGNAWGTSTGGGLSNAATTGAYPFQEGGTGLFLNPVEGLMRGVSITGVASGTGGAFLVNGADIYGLPQSETVTATAGATTVYSKKTYKYILSVTPQFSDAHNYSVGTSDLFGFAYRSDFWEYTNVFWAGAAMSSATGWLVADTTNPATTTTGDVRGTIQVSGNGGGSGIGASASNGTRRLVISQSMSPRNILRATFVNGAPMFGVTPV